MFVDGLATRGGLGFLGVPPADAGAARSPAVRNRPPIVNTEIGHVNTEIGRVNTDGERGTREGTLLRASRASRPLSPPPIEARVA